MQYQETSTPIECWESENRQKKIYPYPKYVLSLWNSLLQDVVMASGLDAFKRGLERFLEENSTAGYKPCIISRLQRKVPPNARCRGGRSGDRDLVVSCAPRGIWWGYCERQEAGLDGPLAGSSRTLLMFLRALLRTLCLGTAALEGRSLCCDLWLL